MFKNPKTALTRIAAAAVLTVGVAGLSASAQAQRFYSGHHYWGGPRFSVGIGLGPCCYGPYYSGYYPYYYEPYPYPYYRTSYYRSYDLDSPLASPYVQQALAAPVGEAVTWNTANAAGSVTTTRDGWAGEKYCREFVQSVNSRETRGTACQSAGGAWQMVANQP